MTGSSLRPSQQLLVNLFDEARIARLGTLQAFMDKGGNVFDLVQRRQADLCKEFKLTAHEGRLLLQRSYSLARYLAREFREQRLTRHEDAGRGPRTGVRALVDGPTFADLFKPDLANSSPAGSIESSVSPVAYLMSIIQWALLNIEPSGAPGQSIGLNMRRPDLWALLIDEGAVNRVEPAISIVTEVLMANIEANKQIPLDIDGLLITTRYPNTLPFDRSWQTIESSVKARRTSNLLGDIVRLTDLQYPYFKETGARGANSDIALRMTSGLAPGQQALLTEPGHTPASSSLGDKSPVVPWVNPRTRHVVEPSNTPLEDFFRDNFNCERYQDLLDLDAFSRATQLDQTGVEALFSIGEFAPVLSPNAPALLRPIDETNPAAPTTPVDFGSVYVNGGQGEPIYLQRVSSGNAVNFRLRNLDSSNQHRFDRINRKVRLDRWLGLAAYETDQLIIASINAENRGGSARVKVIWITDDTMRSIGLFQELRGDYGCTAEECAAFLDVVSVYGRGKELSQFDRIYNAQSLFLKPLQIDDVEFSVVPQNDEDQRTADHICAALGITFSTYRYLAVLIAIAHDPGAGMSAMKLKRSLSVLSSFYRLVRLPRLLGISPLEGVALLDFLDSENDGWLARLAGPTQVALHKFTTQTDTLSVIHAALTAVFWSRHEQLSAMWLMQHVQHVQPVQVPVAAADAELKLLEQLSTQLQPVRMSEALLLDAGVPPDKTLRGWMQLLAELVDDAGLIIGRSGESENSYRDRASVEIKAAVKVADVPPESRPWIEDTILTAVLKTRTGQRSVVQESFAVYLELPSDLVLPVIDWSGGNAYQLLGQAIKAIPAGRLADAAEEPVEPPDPEESEQREFLRLLVELRRRSSVARELKLSSAMLVQYLEGGQSTWFGVEDRSELSLRTIFYLTLYGRAVKLARQPAEKLLDYLKMVNQLPEELSEDALSLVRDAAAGKLADFFGCGIRDVLECAVHVNPLAQDGSGAPKPLIRNLPQLALLLRLLEGEELTGMGFSTLLTLGRLTPKSSDEAYREAAERALESLSRASVSGQDEPLGEFGQSVDVRCQVDNKKLVANVPGEMATFTLVLRNFAGELMKYVDVYWSHSGVGVLLDYATRTDHEGKTSTRLLADSEMGAAHVSYRLDMREEVHAGTVVIDCGDALYFKTLSKEVVPDRDLLADGKDTARVSVQVIDEYGNLAIGKPISWSSMLGTISPEETFTNNEGIARVYLTSRQPGNERVTARHVLSGEATVFTDIRYVDEPRIKAFYIDSAAVVGRSLRLVCDVIGLDGEGDSGYEVRWSVEAVGGTSRTDEHGRAVWTSLLAHAGESEVTAEVGTLGLQERIEIFVAENVLITDWSTDYRVPVAGAREPSMLWIELKDSHSDGARPITNYPVTWRSELISKKGAVTQSITIETDSTGRSTFPFKVSTEGVYRVTAQPENQHSSQVFDLTVEAAFIWDVKLFRLENGVEYPVEQVNDTLPLLRNSRYRLEIEPVSALPEREKATAVVGWSAIHSAAAMGITFTPRLAATEAFKPDEPLSWLIDCADVRDGDFQLALNCSQVSEIFLLPGTLRKPAAS
ncbi:Tc toxin subunit A [Pseudomonas sp. GL-B-26]|uniref:Tc toxin subunit A n=1 Tax=Pseudomonas sp. GL-B-26 TaxID=2832394 RepID=UPI001CC1B076|nr:Tc toxin subunit A [Pseudomonas sp. GL-B-26]